MRGMGHGCCLLCVHCFMVVVAICGCLCSWASLFVVVMDGHCCSQCGRLSVVMCLDGGGKEKRNTSHCQINIVCYP